MNSPAPAAYQRHCGPDSGLASLGSTRPGDDVIDPLTGMGFVYHLAAHRLTGLMHGGATAGDQRMPLWQALPLGQQPVGTGRGQPVILGNLVMGDLQTVRLFFKAVAVIGALAGLGVEQIAGDVGEHQLVGVLVNELVQAALAAAVAQGFPLHIRHLLQGLFLPKRSWLHFLDLLHGRGSLNRPVKRVVIRLMARFFKVDGKTLPVHSECYQQKTRG